MVLGPAVGLEVVAVAEGVVLRSSTATLRLEGGVADLVVGRLLPALTPAVERAALPALLADVPAGELDRVVDSLLDAGALVESPARGDGVPEWLTLVATDVDERRTLATRLATSRVVVLGPAPLTDPLAGLLRSLGADALVRAVPVAVGGTGASAPGTARTSDPDAGSDVEVPVTEADVRALVQGAHAVVVVTDTGLPVLHVWANSAALAAGVPVVHAAVSGTTATVGPLVLPGEGPCYLCWRMRALACADDFATAMALEEGADAHRRPLATPPPQWPTLVPSVTAALTSEVLSVTTGISQPRVAGQVLVVDARAQTSSRHQVLPRPDCPACSKKDRPPRPLPTLADLAGAPPSQTPFDEVTARAVSPVCGVVRALDRIPKDVDEPELPVIVRAELANSLFHDSEGFVGCSGKALDLVWARNTAVAEALERHASLTWQPGEVARGGRAGLTGPSLDPRDLVLYADEQYDRLPYTRYDDDLPLDWVPARSLVSGEQVWVPLDGAHLSHRSGPHTHLFPATSNGFAAGPDLASAVLAALLEVVERDAFLLTWAHRLPTTRHAATGLDDTRARDVALAYARRGVEIDVHVLPTDGAATVALAVGWHDEAPAAVVGLGAALDPLLAARRAVFEVAQVRPALRARLRQPDTHERMLALVADPGAVTELEDHDLLYADPATAARGLGFLRDRPRTPFPTAAAPGGGEPDEATAPGPALERLVPSLAAVAGDVLYVDVTSADVAPLGLTVARGIVPGFQPIHFGAAEARLGHRRLFTAPAAMGLRPDAARPADLNPLPHPLA